LVLLLTLLKRLSGGIPKNVEVEISSSIPRRNWAVLKPGKRGSSRVKDGRIIAGSGEKHAGMEQNEDKARIPAHSEAGGAQKRGSRKDGLRRGQDCEVN
jgi:predicted methyltransferase